MLSAHDALCYGKLLNSSRPDDHSLGRVSTGRILLSHVTAEPVPSIEDPMQSITVLPLTISDAGSANPAHGADAGAVSPPT